MIAKNRNGFFIIQVLIIAIISQFLWGCSGIGKEQISEDKTYLTPIPWSTLSAYRFDMPITNKLEAVIAAQMFLGTSRMDFKEPPKVISVEKITLDKADQMTNKNGSYTNYGRPGNTKVWFVMFEGNWRIIPPSSDPTPEAFYPGCAFVIIDKNEPFVMGSIACPE